MPTIDEHLVALRRAGDALASAAARVPFDTPVPDCPGWHVRDLVRHTGGVHRWAAGFVRTGRTRPTTADEEAELMTSPVADDDLLAWFRAGHAALLDALHAAPDDLTCFTFLPAPSARAFWARRQAHETTVHRIDAQRAATTADPVPAGSAAYAAGDADPTAYAAGAVGPVPAGLAADGVDELLTGFFGRPKRLRWAEPATLSLRAPDVGRDWLVRVGPDGVRVGAGPGDADCAVTAPAAELYLLLWNRRDTSGLDVRGDAGVLRRWRAEAHVTWS
ncbi:maleylpyruvate isomerase family mycothiol-dependent enzyme [Actinocatenispora rupis]|uniref:TIGR03083 family protein n=1 Tax=Actinocatenispora rupis TaxID=519421 RepID=A0A8J3NFM1_9ACTN|nr:maleylpyruvate isomerase family mycothiol-dependent enzyme [Actinocatenispora rupis]GID13949.1 hypothetical protein Aru02nite_48380 [Actinocatenispora rupis]